MCYRGGGRGVVPTDEARQYVTAETLMMEFAYSETKTYLKGGITAETLMMGFVQAR